MQKIRFIFVFLILVLIYGQNVNAQLAPVPETPKNAIVAVEPDSQNQSSSTPSENEVPSVDQQEQKNNTFSNPFSGESPKNNLKDQISAKTNTNEDLEKTSKPNIFPTPLDNETIVKKTVPTRWQPGVSSFLARHNLNLNNIITMLGLFGTFLGLFSTWSIYLLNRKNSDPLVIDRKDSALKYIEAIDQLKEVIFIHKTRKSDAILENVLINGLPPSTSEDFAFLISYYQKVSYEVAEIPLIEVHSRYKKHIKYKYIDTFNGLLIFYKMIKNDSKLYNENFDYKSLKLNNRDWKNKASLLLSIEEKTTNLKNILLKDVKR